MLSNSSIPIGCSGWQYRHWRGDLYPADLPQSRWFEHYAAIFDTVEVNNTFYWLPGAETFDAWKRRAPKGFLFAVRASRYLTHLKKLKDADVRFHGVQRYSGSYGDAVLDEWADWLTMRARAGAPVFAYFNNDTGGHAPRDAVRLRRLMAQTSANL